MNNGLSIFCIFFKVDLFEEYGAAVASCAKNTSIKLQTSDRHNKFNSVQSYVKMSKTVHINNACILVSNA